MAGTAALWRDACKQIIVPALRDRGYKGTAPTWRRTGDHDDVAVVNLQTSDRRGRTLVRANLSVAPSWWLDWRRVELGEGMPRTVTEPLGLIRGSLHSQSPAPTDSWWEVSDGSSAAAVAQHVLATLREYGLPRLERLLDPEGLIEQLETWDERGGPDGWSVAPLHPAVRTGDGSGASAGPFGRGGGPAGQGLGRGPGVDALAR